MGQRMKTDPSFCVYLPSTARTVCRSKTASEYLQGELFLFKKIVEAVDKIGSLFITLA